MDENAQSMHQLERRKKARQELQLPVQTTITDKPNSKNSNQLKSSHDVSDINIC